MLECGKPQDSLHHLRRIALLQTSHHQAFDLRPLLMMPEKESKKKKALHCVLSVDMLWALSKKKKKRKKTRELCVTPYLQTVEALTAAPRTEDISSTASAKVNVGFISTNASKYSTSRGSRIFPTGGVMRFRGDKLPVVSYDMTMFETVPAETQRLQAIWRRVFCWAYRCQSMRSRMSTWYGEVLPGSHVVLWCAILNFDYLRQQTHTEEWRKEVRDPVLYEGGVALASSRAGGLHLPHLLVVFFDRRISRMKFGHLAALPRPSRGPPAALSRPSRGPLAASQSRCLKLGASCCSRSSPVARSCQRSIGSVSTASKRRHMAWCCVCMHVNETGHAQRLNMLKERPRKWFFREEVDFLASLAFVVN